MEKVKVVIWYARISTNELMQKYSLESQKEDIKKYCNYHWYNLKKIILEKASWTKMIKRPKLNNILENEKFDILVCVKIDRLARNVLDLNKIVLNLNYSWKEVVFIENQINTSTINWKLFLNILWAFWEFEAWMISERVKRWLKQAKTNWVKLWRPRIKDIPQSEEIKEIRKLRQQKFSYSKIAKKLWYSGGSVIYLKLKNFKKRRN